MHNYVYNIICTYITTIIVTHEILFLIFKTDKLSLNEAKCKLGFTRQIFLTNIRV